MSDYKLINVKGMANCGIYAYYVNPEAKFYKEDASGNKSDVEMHTDELFDYFCIQHRDKTITKVLAPACVAYYFLLGTLETTKCSVTNIRFKDDDLTNYKLSNLYWGTYSSVCPWCNFRCVFVEK